MASESENNQDAEDDRIEVVEAQIVENKIVLEFSNYARVEVVRQKRKSKKRYYFEFWGRNFTWTRATDRNGKDVADHRWHSFQLHDKSRKRIIACIKPETSDDVIKKEAESGGWVPPSTMQLLDESVYDQSALAE